jgi:hypothetical protein
VRAEEDVVPERKVPLRPEGREGVSLAATDAKKLSEINQVQRNLFAGMPRRLDYSPRRDNAGLQRRSEQVCRPRGDAPLEKECKKLGVAISLMKEKVKTMK